MAPERGEPGDECAKGAFGGRLRRGQLGAPVNMAEEPGGQGGRRAGSFQEQGLPVQRGDPFLAPAICGAVVHGCQKSQSEKEGADNQKQADHGRQQGDCCRGALPACAGPVRHDRPRPGDR
jgi:hypothetical protein